MDKILLTKNSNNREATLTVPLELRAKVSFNVITDIIMMNNCNLTVYKVDLQKVIILNIKGEENSIKNVTNKIEGLL